MPSTVGPNSLWHATKAAVRRGRDLGHDLQCLLLPRRRAEQYPLPDAVIVGAQKCGTTSLHHYLLQHPAVSRATKKEIHYFDHNHDRGLKWYRLHFPRDHGGLNFESTPYYLFHPHVAGRLAAIVPHARLIVMLRDPVARAHSHYWHETRLGHEHLSFADAIEAEADRLAGADARLGEDGYRSYNHEHYSYVARGRYVEQLERWFRFFPREQFLFIESERFFKDPAQEMGRVTTFLGLPPVGDVAWTKRNAGSYAERIEPSLRSALRQRFVEANKGLEHHTGMTWSWNR